MRAVGYVLFMIGIVVVFGKLWVELGGLSPKSAAQNLLDADVQIPGFRRSNKPVEGITEQVHSISYNYWLYDFGSYSRCI